MYGCITHVLFWFQNQMEILTARADRVSVRKTRWRVPAANTFQASVLEQTIVVVASRVSIVVGTPGSQSRESGFESPCCRFQAIGYFVHPTLPQFTINEYLSNRHRWIYKRTVFAQ